MMPFASPAVVIGRAPRARRYMKPVRSTIRIAEARSAAGGSAPPVTECPTVPLRVAVTSMLVSSGPGGTVAGMRVRMGAR